MEFWNNIYSYFSPIAFDLKFIKIHWYGIMYALALIVSVWFFLKSFRDDKNYTEKFLNGFILWCEIGVILGARLGWVLFYSDNPTFYLTNPIEIFNPYYNGEFVGISGMSFHGGFIGFLIASFIYTHKHKKDYFYLTDKAVVAISLGYIFGRVANFLNQELIGRETTVSWGIYVDGVLRHPSQLYEAFLEGFILFTILYFLSKYIKESGVLTLVYFLGYFLFRSVCEIYREPDNNIGFIFNTDWLTMGMFLSLVIGIICISIFLFLKIKTRS